MNEPLSPLDADLRALLDRARDGAPTPPAGLEDQVLAQVGATNAAAAVAKATTTKLALAGGAAIALVAAVLAFRPVAPTPVVAPSDVDAPVASVAPPVAPSNVDVPAPPAPVAAPSVEAPVKSSAPKPAESEGALLERARGALKRGDADAALAALQAHQRAYARGELVEERRALTVVAYAKRGDRDRAQAAARAFLREYPSSLFADTVRAASGE